MLSPVRVLFGACLLALLLAPLPVAAQQDTTAAESDPPTADTTQLPEIAPREIEIRGELQIGFPSLERQPLRGFASPPAQPSVSATRTPYVEPYQQELEAVSDQLPVPESIAAPVQASPPPILGYLEAGGGRYFSRFANGRFSVPLSSHERVSVRADYTGAEGFSPFDDLNVETPSDEASGHIRFETRRAPVKATATARGLVDDYTLYGVPRSTTSSFVPDRTLYSGGLAGSIQSVGSTPARLGVTYDQHQYNTTVASDSTATFRERRLGVEGHLGLAFNGIEGTLDAAYSRSLLGGDVPGGTEQDVEAGATATVFEEHDLTVTAGGRFLWATGPGFPAVSSSPDATDTFLLPFVDAEWAVASWATVFARNTPHLDGASLRSYHRHNPYEQTAPPLRPTVYTTDARAGLDLTRGWLRLRAEAGFRYAPSYRYHVPAGGQFAVGYDAARILHGGGQVALQGVDNVQASLGISLRNGTLPAREADIPYFATVTADAMTALTFAEGDAYLQATGTLYGPRPTDRSGTDEIGTYVTLDLEGSYALTSTIDAVLRLENLSAEAPEQWPQYPQPPAQISGGFRIRW